MQHDSTHHLTLIALVCALAATIMLAGCSSTSNTSGDSSSDEATVATEVVHTDGNPDVWYRIEHGTSCADLAAEYDTALDNAEARTPGDPLRTLSLDYARAARERGTELGCPGT